MKYPWEAEQSIGPALALEVIKTQFPGLHAKSIELLGSGWDNDAYLVNGSFVFRFPRREVAVAILEHEAAFLPRIEKLLPLAVPLPKWRGKPAGGYPWPFIGYPHLPGISACGANLSDEERGESAEPLARFLKALHAIPLSIGHEAHLPGDLIARLDVEKLTKAIKKNLEALEQLEGFDQILAQAPLLRKPHCSAIVHGDFYVRHLLVDSKHQLTAVIDWGDVHLGDIAVDLSIAHSFLPPAHHSLFRAAYGEIDDQTWRLARFRALHHSAYIVNFGQATSDKAIVREGLKALGWIRLSQHSS
jgi:aminoglycoside phosphotransferase (APT) family kinase protein